MNELHLFAGIGGGILGGMLLGHTCICAVEIEPYCQKILLQRQRDGILPKFPIWDDIKTFDGRPWKGYAHVVCGGFPCQDISPAGKGKGIEGERSGLWAEMARIISEVRPMYVFVENSSMLTIRGLGRVLGDLAKMGYDARWGILGGVDAGAPHFRDRIWILANSDKKRSRSIQEKCRSSRQVLRDALSAKTILQIRQDIWNERILRTVGLASGASVNLDAIAASGNSQIPQVVKLAWETLKN